jgi:hypothetical protein
MVPQPGFELLRRFIPLCAALRKECASGGACRTDMGASTISGFSSDKIVLALNGAGTLNDSYRNVDTRLGGSPG